MRMLCQMKSLDIVDCSVTKELSHVNVEIIISALTVLLTGCEYLGEIGT